MITPSGKNLEIIINCDYLKHHHWMSFASWYSIKKNLPDAEVSINCKRGIDKFNLFNWTYKLGVPFSYEKIDIKNQLVIDPTVMAVRPYMEDSVGPINVKLDDYITFINYEEGIGKFVTSRWINKIKSPFYRNLIFFHTSDMTLNELKALKIWENLFPLYAETQRRSDEKIQL